MGIHDTFENDLMKLIFNATAIANIADNAATSPLTNLFISLMTGAAPADAATADASEVTYTSYNRSTTARTSGGFTVTANSVSPVANIDFVTGTGGAGTVTYCALTVIVTPANASKVLFSGTVTPNIVCGNGVTPRLTTASAFTID